MRRLPLVAGGLLLLALADTARSRDGLQPREHIAIRGIYGGVPTELMKDGKTLVQAGVNAVWIGERGINAKRVATLKAQGVKVFAEFNTLHWKAYLKEHPDAAPIGVDGKPCPPPHGWQGICPSHKAYRQWRMQAFRTLLTKHDLDGVWLDYHHGHASWERAEPALPDTCFCSSCLKGFAAATGIDVAEKPIPDAAKLLLGTHRKAWIDWRCGVFTDWVRAFHDIRDEVRPKALLGTFHCPWTDTERNGALRDKLAIDLRAQSKFIDVFSPMPYHARFGHAKDPAWIARQVTWLRTHLGSTKHGIWPIVQLSDWGEKVPLEQVPIVLDHGTRKPSTGVMVFAWGSLRKQPEKVKAMADFYRAIQPRVPK